MINNFNQTILMKKSLLAIALLGLALQGFSQNSLETGTTRQNGAANSTSDAGIGSAGSSLYCSSAGLSTANEYINLVNFAGSDYVSGNNGGYGDFTSVVSDVIAGQTTVIQVRAGFTGAVRKEAWTLYMDCN